MNNVILFIHPVGWIIESSFFMGDKHSLEQAYLKNKNKKWTYFVLWWLGLRMISINEKLLCNIQTNYEHMMDLFYTGLLDLWWHLLSIVTAAQFDAPAEPTGFTQPHKNHPLIGLKHYWAMSLMLFIATLPGLVFVPAHPSQDIANCQDYPDGPCCPL